MTTLPIIEHIFTVFGLNASNKVKVKNSFVSFFGEGVEFRSVSVSCCRYPGNNSKQSSPDDGYFAVVLVGCRRASSSTAWSPSMTAARSVYSSFLYFSSVSVSLVGSLLTANVFLMIYGFFKCHGMRPSLGTSCLPLNAMELEQMAHEIRVLFVGLPLCSGLVAKNVNNSMDLTFFGVQCSDFDRPMTDNMENDEKWQ